VNRIAVLAAAGALAVVGVGSYAVSQRAAAQNAPAVQAEDPMQPWQVADNADGGGARDGQHGWGDGRHGWGDGPGAAFRHRFWMMAHRRLHDFGLFYPVADKNLSTADVQIIAQAILLRHGNHTWKVANVAQNQDNTISFAFTTPDGDVVARFAIETQTGRLRRIG
jgi:hypothetical protein